MTDPGKADRVDPVRPRELRQLLARAGIHPQRRLGQNFLIDGNVRDRIIAAAQLRPDDAVLEVGPGAGALTLALVEQCALVVAVEKDRRLLQVLADLVPPQAPLELMGADALTIPWGETLQQAAGRRGLQPGRLLFIANLPYSITGPALARLLAEERQFSHAVVMVQKEVGDRLAAAPAGKDYGSLTLLAQYHGHVEKLFTVSPGSFWPRPAVESMVVRFRRHDAPPVAAPEEMLFAVIRAAFAQRRKTIRNALAAGLNMAPATVAAVLEAAAIDGARRGETLTLTEFARVAQHMPGADGDGDR